MSKRRIKKNRIGLLIVSVLIVATLLFLGGLGIEKLIKKNISKKGYLASNVPTIVTYDLEYNVGEALVRGIEVTFNEEKVVHEDKEYYKIKYNKKDYLVSTNNIVLESNKVVLEKEMYVRTPATLYVNEKDSKILSYLKKGTKVDIISYDKLNSDGNVNMYQIKSDEQTGYVYSKYLVDSYEDAIKNYDEEVTYAYHKNRKFSYELYGGSGANLDYYPVDKPKFEDNIMPTNTRSLYLNGGYLTIGQIEDYIALAKKGAVNTFVVDIKDGFMAYESEVAKEYSISNYKSASNSYEKYKNAIKRLKEEGFYVIGRITAFNDSNFAYDNPTETISSSNGVKTKWVSACSRKAWEFNVELAKEAVTEFGFNEIQFDYVRFPESSYTYSKGNYNFKNTYNEEKAQAIQNFLIYACDQIHKLNAYVSADVFGESSYEYISAYGQYWPAISNVVDAISAMPYTDHFNTNDKSTWENPYDTVLTWAKTAAKRQKEIPTPAIARTWVTAYNTPHWKPYVTYGASEIERQVLALKDAGLGTSFITWNSGSSYSKYSEIISAFKEAY